MSEEQLNEQGSWSILALEGIDELNLTEEQFKELKDAFDLFDIDGSATID